METLVERIISEIASGAKPFWNKDEKIRYVYITLGKLMSKNVKFFYSLGNKLATENYSYDEIKHVYEDENTDSLSVICKSSCLILKSIFDKLNIDCKLIQTIEYNRIKKEGKEIDIYHWFICCTGENDRKYFLTLVPDLCNIQFNMPTKHFANNIDYERLNKKGEIVQVYQGEKINNHFMTDEEIKKLDVTIGYINKPYMTADRKGKIDVVYEYDDVFIKNLVEYIKMDKYYEELGFDTPFYKDTISYQIDGINIEEYLSKEDRDMSKINEWLQYIEQKISERFNKNTIEYKDCIGKLKALKVVIEKKDAHKYRQIMGHLAAKFVDDRYKVRTDGYCTTTYITKKFEYLFPKFFNCNEANQRPLTSRFNGLGEQLDFIDMFMENMFLELRRKNASRERHNTKYTIVRNRIQRYIIYNKNDKTYNIVFSIDNENIYFFFNPNTGEFHRVKNFLELIDEKYIIVSDELKNRMRKVEDIESDKPKNKEK